MTTVINQRATFADEDGDDIEEFLDDLLGISFYDDQGVHLGDNEEFVVKRRSSDGNFVIQTSNGEVEVTDTLDVVIPGDLVVSGSTTEVDNVVTGDITVEDGIGNKLVRFDATSDPVKLDFFNHAVSNMGISGKLVYGPGPDFAVRYDSGDDELVWSDEDNGDDVKSVDRDGNLQLQGTLTEGTTV